MNTTLVKGTRTITAAFHPSSRWARGIPVISRPALDMLRHQEFHRSVGDYIDTEITDKELANKENWMSENIRET